MNVNVSYVTQYIIAFSAGNPYKKYKNQYIKIILHSFFPSWSLKPGVYSTHVQHMPVWTTHVQVLSSRMWGYCLRFQTLQV